MAIAHDTFTRFPSTGDGDVTSGDRSFTHTPVGTPAGVVVVVLHNANSTPCTNVSYGGIDMGDLFHADDSTEAGRCVIWALTGVAIPTGAQTVTLDSCSTTTKLVGCFTVTSATNYSAVNATNTNTTASATNPTVTITTTAEAMLYGGFHHGATTDTQTVGANTTEDATTLYGTNSGAICHSSGAQAAGTPSLNYTAAADDWAFAGVAIAEAAGPAQAGSSLLVVKQAIGRANW